MSKHQPTYQRIKRFTSLLQNHYRSLMRKRSWFLGISALVTLFSGILILGLMETILYLPPSIKIASLIIILTISGALSYYLSLTIQNPSYNEFYKNFGKEFDVPELTDALDLYAVDEDSQLRLHKAAILQNLEKLDETKISAKLTGYRKEHSISKKYKSGLGGFAGIFLVLLIFSFWQPNAMNRLGRFWAEFHPPNPYSYTVHPGSVTLEQGKSFEPEISFSGDLPEKLSIAYKTDRESEFRIRNADKVESEKASFSPISLSADGSYYFEMDGFRTPSYDISVKLRPRFDRLSLQVIPPPYTKLDTTSYTYSFSQIQPYEGSQIRLTASTNKKVSEVTLFHSDTTEANNQNLSITDSLTYRHQWQAETQDTVTFLIEDEEGLTNENRFRFTIKPRSDQRPFVSIIKPESNLKMKSPEALELQYEAGDDFGLTSARLHYELQQAFSSKPDKGSISLKQPAINREQSYNWDLTALNLKPRDALTYWVEVTDNDEFNGYKAGLSRKLTITVPSMTEYMDELENREDEVTESLENVSESFREMEREYQQFKENLKRNPETSWEQKKQLQQVEDQRKEIDKEVDELNQKFEQIRKEIEQSEAMTPETVKAYDELQKLMHEINDPELEKALRELQESLGKMSPEQMRKALQNYEFNEEQYRQRIERTMELFKSLKLNSDLDKLARSLQELADQEQQLSENDEDSAGEAEQQKAIQKDFEDLQNELDSLNQNAPDKARKQIGELQNDAGERMEQTREMLQENIKELQNNSESDKNGEKIRNQQQKIQRQMQQMSEMMTSAKQQMNQQQIQVNIQALEYILYSMIDLSTKQEELTRETESLPNRSQAFVDKARNEQNIARRFSALSDSLFELSSEIPRFSNRINKRKSEIENFLDRSVEMLSERNKSNSTTAMRESMGGINDLSSMLASLLENLQNQQSGGSGGGMTMQQMIEQMQKMSGQQQKLNEQIQNMINDMQGDRLSRDQMKRLNQLSRQQNRIRKQLKKLQESGELESGDRVLSELERMSERMEDAINDLRGGQLDQQLMQRQQNILSRMLNAEKAVQERGKEDRREATTAEDQPETTPPDVTIEELQKKIRNMLNDPEFTRFSEDYQRLIEQYFELLRERES